MLVAKHSLDIRNAFYAVGSIRRKLRVLFLHQRTFLSDYSNKIRTMTHNDRRLRFLENMRRKCSAEYYRDSLKEMSADDLKIVAIETAVVLQYVRLRNLPLKHFADLVEKRLKKYGATVHVHQRRK